MLALREDALSPWLVHGFIGFSLQPLSELQWWEGRSTAKFSLSGVRLLRRYGDSSVEPPM